ncbi:MAG: hypothetical protein ACLGJE_02590 [Gammaproteobacteria bacterium]
MSPATDKLINDLIANRNFFEVYSARSENILLPRASEQLRSSIDALTNPSVDERVSAEEFLDLKNYFQLFALCEKKYECIVLLINQVDSHTVRPLYYSNRITEWIDVWSQIAKLNQTLEPLYDKNIKCRAEAILRLRSNGIEIILDQADAVLTEKVRIQILSRIKYRAEKVGHNLFLMVLHIIETNHYRPMHERYYFRKELSILSNSPQSPLGYLYQLSLAHLEKKKKNRDTFRQLKEIFELSEDLVTLMGVQRVDYLEGFMNKPVDLLPFLQKSTIHDQLFTLDQMNKQDALTLMDGLFSDCPSLAVYRDIYRAMIKYPGRQSLYFYKDLIVRELCMRHTAADVGNAIDELSFSSQEINLDYLNPLNVEKLNSFQKPFIKRKDDYLFPHPHFAHAGFIYTMYDKLLSSLKERNYKGARLSQEIGRRSEKLVENILSQYRVRYLAGKKYIVTKDFFDEIGSTAKEGECDFVIESPSHIMFIELKSKTLTANARSGNSISVLLDLALSLFTSIEQAGRHEYALRRKGKIDFTDGTSLDLKGRYIEKISLTVFDFNSLADVNLIQDLLAFIPNMKFFSKESDEQEKLSKIKKVVDKLKMQQQCDVFREVYEKPYGRSINFGNRFFSVGQFMSMLKYSRSTEHFVELINKTRQLGNNTKDWYYIFNNFVIDMPNNQGVFSRDYKQKT